MQHRLVASALLAAAVASATAPAHALRIKQTQPAEASSSFAFDAYGELAHQDGNIAFSPASIYLALALLQQGAGGDDAARIERTMHLTGWGDGRGLAAAYKGWLGLLSPSGKNAPQLRIGNGIWVDHDAPLRSSYVRSVRRGLGARVVHTDFERHPDRSRRSINHWISQRTGKHIPELLPAGSLDSSTVAVLVNAIYFEGRWATPFDAASTSDADFHLADGKTVKVPTMNRVGAARYASAKDAVLVELPYAGSTLAMDVIVPSGDKTVADLEPTLAVRFPTWIAALRDEEQVQIALPRFTVDQRTDLAGLLGALGLGSLFSHVDLSRMFRGGDFFLSGAYHQTFIEVDEHGTKAAAASAIAISETAVHQTYPVIADRPFLWVIRDTATGTILFMGRTADPRA